MPDVVLIEESALSEQHFAGWTKMPGFAIQRWTDAWIAAIARSAKARGGSFDGLHFLHLDA